MIPQPFIYDLLNRVDIVDAIDRHVPQKRPHLLSARLNSFIIALVVARTGTQLVF